MGYKKYAYQKTVIMKVFSSFLRKIRSEHCLSQEGLRALLAERSHSFDSLDTISISRWERGINTPSLTKQSEIAEVFGEDLFNIYSSDASFVEESVYSIQLSSSGKSDKAAHPYYNYEQYHTKSMLSDHANFSSMLKLCLMYEGNPRLFPAHQEIASTTSLKPLNLVSAFCSFSQLVGHCLFCKVNTKALFEFMNCSIDIMELLNVAKQDRANVLVVLSSFGVSPQIDNHMMSVYLNQLAMDKTIEYLSFSTCDSKLKQKLMQMKIPMFKVKPIEHQSKTIQNYSFIMSRSEVMANRNMLMLSVIPTINIKPMNSGITES
ncbi:helix-turn-helix transcriptional regulator [Moritella sp. 24]|uniref:helix-turn-helix domain-containing protein n=1 Tax=Moritella sp. 24 TaxID=2746230 RepID=UPI001BAAAAFD|nr:helix-turn-helix transcriptional regulator [Moritella sp. 24]QUM75591.1 helix-turn-helix transcriptional regulator [Moritella sp. 24]